MIKGFCVLMRIPFLTHMLTKFQRTKSNLQFPTHSNFVNYVFILARWFLKYRHWKTQAKEDRCNVQGFPITLHFGIYTILEARHMVESYPLKQHTCGARQLSIFALLLTTFRPCCFDDISLRALFIHSLANLVWFHDGALVRPKQRSK